MYYRVLLDCVLISAVTPAASAPLPRYTLAPPPHEKPPPPWKRIDLCAPTRIPLEPQKTASGVLTFAVQGNYRLALGNCMPRSVSASDLEVLRQSGFNGPQYHAVLESKRGTEVVIICHEEQPQIGDRVFSGRVAVTLTWKEKDKYQVTGIHMGESAAFKPLLEVFYEAYPASRHRKP